MTNRYLGLSVAASLRRGVPLSALLLASTAYAQTAGNAEVAPLEEIVITGTLIRGAAPVGTHVIDLSQEKVQETGATTTAQLLQSIPQLGQFNSLQQPAGAFNAVSTNRPNLRNFPGFQTSGGSSTLILVDGHRVVGMGIQSTSMDPDIVPPGIIDHVEILPDGGSAIYGSDAVAGVMNFITLKKFDGLKADARYGFANSYRTFDANATGGHDWGSGSAYLSYNHSEHGDILGRDRDYIRMYPRKLTVTGGFIPVTSIRCSPGNVQAAGTIYALPYTTATAVPGTANQCDESDAVTIYPKEHRDSAFVGLTQTLSDSLELEARGFYTRRKVLSDLGPNLDTEFVAPFITPSPFFAAHRVSASPFEFHQISLSWGDQRQRLSMDTWGIAPQLTAQLGGSWQLRAVASYGESRTENHVGQFNSTAIPAAIATGAFNPYDPNSSAPEGLAAAGFYETFGLSRQKQANVRAVVDGELFTLPGGAVKLATGIEFDRDTLISQKGTAVPGTQDSGYAGLVYNGTTIVAAAGPLPVVALHRTVQSAFGELIVPIFGEGFSIPGLHELSVSASGRYDHYSDFGDTTNPKVGLTYKPIEWITLRGSWGKSFEAPSLADTPATDVTGYNQVSGLSFLLPSVSLQAPAGPYPVPGPAQQQCRGGAG